MEQFGEMSLVVVQRKRTSSFSCPPAKAPRVTMAATLRRTESCVDVRFYKDQRDHRRRAHSVLRSLPRTSLRQPTHTVKSPSPPRAQPPPPATKPRLSSPLSPSRSPRPGRPLFPRSKPEPDLYRKALTTCMRGSPEGQKILRMGPHLAVSMMSATMDLERLVASAAGDDADADGDPDGDVPMHDATTSCVALDDWEMVDCAE
ncbi:hypothetical protein C0993_007249 [Termitomyces sp. T159_Od127]|nr:hypothetical protein C0993_007249 [Termitomyces sp. T159_Od127]